MHTQQGFGGGLLNSGQSRQEAGMNKKSHAMMHSTNQSRFFSDDPKTQFITRRVENNRPQPRFVVKDNASDDEDNEEEFTASPAEDIPRNRLVDKLVRGLQAYIQRMQKRESYRIDVKNVQDSRWMPAPRECATMTTVGYKLYMIGGLNFDACKEVVRAQIIGDSINWERIPYTSTEMIQGRQCHTSVHYQNKIYTFGGCFMFNKKRQVRECTN